MACEELWASERDGGVRRDEPSSRDRALDLFIHSVAPLPFHIFCHWLRLRSTFFPIPAAWLSPASWWKRTQCPGRAPILA